VAADGRDRELWISVKGYPESSAYVQARHWFAGAVFDLILYRDEDTEVALAVAFPADFKTFITLAKRTRWLRQAMPFSIFWVHESGEVTME
jgi:hypothetical protein